MRRISALKSAFIAENSFEMRGFMPIADMQFARADGSSQRFYSMSAQIRQERKQYYSVLEKTQSDDLDITAWLTWFLECLGRSIDASDVILAWVMRMAKVWMMPVAQKFNDRQRLMLNKLLDGFDGKLTSSKWAKIAKCSQDTATRDIQDLVLKGILIKDGLGGGAPTICSQYKIGR